MLKWIFMAVPLYLSYYTLMFAIRVLKKEKNILGFVFLCILTISLTVLPVWLLMR